MTNYESVPKLLRAMAGGTDAQKSRQDVIFNAAAQLIDENAAIMKELENVPGLNALDKVKLLKAWYDDCF